MKVLLEEDLVKGVAEKEILFRTLLHHPKIEAVRSRGLMMAVAFDSFETNKKVIDACIEKGVLTDWFLFAPTCLRIAPPLTISAEEITKACQVIVDCLNGL
jgi:acetylornithine/N-succinyldiaminopimelate aminotransferase